MRRQHVLALGGLFAVIVVGTLLFTGIDTSAAPAGAPNGAGRDAPRRVPDISDQVRAVAEEAAAKAVAAKEAAARALRDRQQQQQENAAVAAQRARERKQQEDAAAAAKAAAAAAAAAAAVASQSSGSPVPLNPELREALAFFKVPGRKIVLMGNDGVQEFFPQRAQRMGGIENAVVTLANGLHRLGFDFLVIAQCTGMDPVSSTTPLAGVPYTVYCMPAFGSYLPACQDFVRSMNPKPAVVLGQSDWSARVAEAADVPMVVTNHDSLPSIAGKLIHHPKVLYRFLSDWMRKIWHEYGKEWLPRRGFYAYHSIEPDACPAVLPKSQRSGHIMYMSSQWGPELKGLDKFCEFAKRAQSVTNRTFVIYGPNSIPGGYQGVSNLRVMGDVAGKARDDAYRNALIYVMLTQLPEAFGRVTLEAMCMGTPVLSSCFGTQPELIYGDKGGWSTDNNYDQMLAFLKKVEQADDAYFEAIQRYATTTFVQDEEIARVLYAARLLIEYPDPAEHEKRLAEFFTNLPYAGNSREPSEKTTAACKAH